MRFPELMGIAALAVLTNTCHSMFSEEHLFLGQQEKFILPEKNFYVDDMTASLTRRFQHTGAIKVHSKTQIQKYSRTEEIPYTDSINTRLFHDFVHFNFFFDEIQVVQFIRERSVNKVPLKVIEARQRKKFNLVAQVQKITGEFILVVQFKLKRWQVLNHKMGRVKEYTFEYKDMHVPVNLHRCFSFVRKFLDGYVFSFLKYEFKMSRTQMNFRMTPFFEFSRANRRNRDDVSIQELQRRLVTRPFFVENLSFLNFFHYNHFKLTYNPENVSLTSLNNSMRRAFVDMVQKHDSLNGTKFFERSVKKVVKDIMLHLRLKYVPAHSKEGVQDEKELNEHFFVLEFKGLKTVIRLLKDEYFLTEPFFFLSDQYTRDFLAKVNPRFACWLDPLYNLYVPSFLNYVRFQRYYQEFKHVSLQCNQSKPQKSYFLLWRKTKDFHKSKHLFHMQNDFELDKDRICRWDIFSNTFFSSKWDVNEDTLLSDYKRNNLFQLVSDRARIKRATMKRNQTKKLKKMMVKMKKENGKDRKNKKEIEKLGVIIDDLEHPETRSGNSISFESKDPVVHSEGEGVRPSPSSESDCQSTFTPQDFESQHLTSKRTKEIKELFLANRNIYPFGRLKSVPKGRDSGSQFNVMKVVVDDQMRELQSTPILEYLGPDLLVDCLEVIIRETRDLFWIVCPLKSTNIALFVSNKYYQDKFEKVFEVEYCAFRLDYINARPLFSMHVDFGSNRVMIHCLRFSYLFQKNLGFVEIGMDVDRVDSPKLEQPDPLTINGRSHKNILSTFFMVLGKFIFIIFVNK